MSKYGVVSGPYFPVLGLNTEKYGPEITPHLDTFHAVIILFIRYHNYDLLLHYDTEISIPDFSTAGVLLLYSNQLKSMKRLKNLIWFNLISESYIIRSSWILATYGNFKLKY